MAKRKRVVEEIEPASDMPDMPVEAVLTPEPETRYTVHSWNASPLYRCTACAFDAFDVQKVIDHYEKYHRLVAVDPPSVSLDYEAIARARKQRKRIRNMGG